MSELFALSSGTAQKRVRESAVDTVINFIKKAMLTRELKPGDKLPNEFEISANLAVSRGSVREAMKVLSALGLIRIAQGNGTYVSESVNESLFDPVLLNLFMTTDDKEALFQLREMFETFIVHLLIRKNDDGSIAEAETIHEDIQKMIGEGETDPSVTSHYDLKFHLALSKATGNIFLHKIYSSLMSYFYPIIERNHRLEGPQEGFVKLHEEMLRVIRIRDDESVENVIDNSVRWWLRNFD